MAAALLGGGKPSDDSTDRFFASLDQTLESGMLDVEEANEMLHDMDDTDEMDVDPRTGKKRSATEANEVPPPTDFDEQTMFENL